MVGVGVVKGQAVYSFEKALNNVICQSGALLVSPVLGLGDYFDGHLTHFSNGNSPKTSHVSYYQIMQTVGYVEQKLRFYINRTYKQNNDVSNHYRTCTINIKYRHRLFVCGFWMPLTHAFKCKSKLFGLTM